MAVAEKRYYCVRHLPPTNGARCSVNCGVNDGADFKPNCGFVREREPKPTVAAGLRSLSGEG